MSPHPYDLEPVEPVIQFAQAKYRFAEPVDALAGIDSRPDLLKMDWYKFENLIRQLFEAMGLEVQVTQSSRDEGIDAVAYNKTDIGFVNTKWLHCSLLIGPRREQLRGGSSPLIWPRAAGVAGWG